MRKVVLLVFAVILVMGLAFNAGAVEKSKSDCQRGMQMHGDDCGCSGPDSHFAMFKKLGLDDKQKEAIHAIHLSTKKEMIKKKAEAQLAEIDLREMLSKDTVDLVAAEAAVKKVEGLKSDIKMLHIKAMEEIKSNLNAEQKKQFRSIAADMMMGHKMMRHGMMMGGCECPMHGKHPMHEKGSKKPESPKKPEQK